jgi:hypothetical protein
MPIPTTPPSQPTVVARAGGNSIDRDLVDAILGMRERAHAASECNGSLRPQVIETLLWIGGAGVVWAITAFFV